MSISTPKTDLHRLVRRSLLAAPAAQVVYALQMYLFFTHPEAAFNRMVVLVECLCLCTFTHVLFRTVLRPIQSLIGEGFIRAGSVVVFLLMLLSVFYIWNYPINYVSRSIFLWMAALEIMLLFLLVLVLRAWMVSRKHIN